MLQGLNRLWLSLRPALHVLERELIVFPLAVVLVAMATLWLGGTCALWQVWAGAAIAFGAAACDRRCGWRDRLKGMALFLLFLAAVWVLAGCLSENAFDNARYRHPVTRLLMEGWNPTVAYTPETLAQWVDLGEVPPWHILFISHAAEVFNAPFGFFLGTPFNVAFPLLFFIAPVMLAAIWRFGRDLGWGRIARLAAVACIFGAVVRLAGMDSVVDVVIGLSGAALVAAMARALRGKTDWWLLSAASLWMMTAKQSSLLTCFVLWVCFSIALLWRCRAEWKRALGRLSLCGALLVIGFCWICSWPALTTWAHYGHPLYPAYSVDEARFPTYDITWDFRVQNDDAKAMGHVGHFVNGYISQTLAHAYYAWKLDRPDFMPDSEVWRQRGPNSGGASDLPTRVLLVSAFVILFAFGRGARPAAALSLIALFCFPAIYAGWTRYVPWIGIVHGLAIGVVADLCARHLRRWHIGAVMGSGFAGVGALLVAMQVAVLIDYTAELETAFRAPGVRAVLLPDQQECLANMRLLCRQTPALRDAAILPPDTTAPNLRRFTLPAFAAILNDGPQPPKSLYAQAISSPSRLNRYAAYVTFIPRTYAITLPKLVWCRIASLWGDASEPRQGG